MPANIPLLQENLSKLPDGVGRPTYDRTPLKTGIVHVGVGGFHRAHEAYYTHLLLEAGKAKDWAICGVGLREGDRQMGEVLKQQDFLYSMIVRHPDGKIETTVIGSIVEFLLGPDNPGAVINRMAAPETRIVSLTITEGGYNVNPATGAFDFDNTDISHDLEHPDAPVTVFGYLAAALRKRRDEGREAFTVQSCDNVQHNGDVTRRALLAFTERLDPGLAEWIGANVRFPNAMVDRITPRTTPADTNYLQQEFGLKDEWPVTCEPFMQWVIEDDFSDGRPAWEAVGAQFVPDVTPYEKMKLRLLNAGHSVLGLLGAIHGHETIDGCIADPLFAGYLRDFLDKEATPVLDTVEGIDLQAYKDSLIERFGNPNVKDGLARICAESSAKLPKFLIETIRENLVAGGSIDYSALIIATWCYYSDTHADRFGKPLEVIDEQKEELQKAAKETTEDPLAFLRQEELFGDLVKDERFGSKYAELVERLYADPDVGVLMREVRKGS
ncbi:mannitol dehydrogenase family protein [Neolewinella persica]|uniref:mannitol dehydrogenase family protein n=1 Tax=Neolewinella persica TaxID=70998 RepID=UPI0003801757|nr:mannitol dehydrogenase family protein [Neolewinella persica]